MNIKPGLIINGPGLNQFITTLLQWTIDLYLAIKFGYFDTFQTRYRNFSIFCYIAC